MDVREFPVLTDGDEDDVERLSWGLGDDAARALAYLLGRLEDPSLSRTATLTAVQVGTGLGRSAARTALEALARDGLVAETTAETTTPGRPPKAWHAIDSRAETTRRAYERHAKRLLRRAERVDGRRDAGEGRNGDEGDRDVAEDGRSDGEDGDGRLAIGLNWRPNGLHLPLFAARRATDDDLAFEPYDGSAAAARAVAAGEVDVAVAGAATVASERARGRPIVPIATCYRRSPVVLYTTAEAFGGPFDGIERLEGKRLGTPPNSETELLARLVLEQAGLADSVEVVPVGGEERAALRSGDADVVTGVAPDRWRTDEAVDVLAVADHYPVYGPALVANRETLRRDRSRLERALAAATAGWARACRDPGPAAAELAARSPESAAAIERTFDRARERFGVTDAVRDDGWGWHSAGEWADLRAALERGAVL